MKYKEFNKWCNERAYDGCWGLTEALTAINVNNKILEFPFWKREKIWKEEYEGWVVENIVRPTNNLILKYLEEIKDMEEESNYGTK